MSEVETEDIYLLTVHDHHLAVVTHQVSGGSSDRHTARQKTHFQLSELVLTAAIGERDQRMHKESAFHGRQSTHVRSHRIEPEDHDLDRLLGLAYSFYQALDAMARLNDELHLCAIPRRLDAELPACVFALE
jgi:hypothetical protein